MTRLRTPILAALAGALALAAPAAAQSIRLVNVSGYTVIDREHLILNGGASRHYLVTLRRPCWGLQTNSQVGMSFPPTTTLHSPHMEYVFTQPDERCYIDTVEQVESWSAARELVDTRAQSAAPEESES